MLDFTLTRDPLGRLALYRKDDKHPLCIDFSNPDYRKRVHQAIHQGDPLLDACKIQGSTVIDATAGLGQDGFLLAAKGYHVQLFEHHPWIYALLEDALARARGVPELQAICQRIQLHPQAFETPIDPPVDAVYLDPMFPSKAKSALPSKAMQWMSIMTENCLTDEKLLEIAMDSATEKVILKRPLHAPILAPDQLRGQKKGKSHRFDIYMGRASRAQSTHVIM